MLTRWVDDETKQEYFLNEIQERMVVTRLGLVLISHGTVEGRKVLNVFRDLLHLKNYIRYKEEKYEKIHHLYEAETYIGSNSNLSTIHQAIAQKLPHVELSIS